MLRERMTLVINNHRFSCSHTDQFIYILKGFSELNDFALPFPHINAIKDGDHAYLYLEEWEQYEVLIQDHLLSGYRLAVLDFNFFQPLYLSRLQENYCFIEDSWRSLPQAEHVPMFNMKNPLIGISDNLSLNQQDKLALLKAEKLII